MPDPRFDVTQVLQRAPNLRLHLDSHESAVVRVGPRKVRCGHHALAILDAFARPRTFQDGLAALRGHVTGAQDWMDMTTTAIELARVGALTDPATAHVHSGASAFDSPHIHTRMLNDRKRTERFIRALRETICAGQDVVVDIGTGTGVLAVAAAQAGARRVFAVEVGQIGQVAEQMFEVNGVADRVELVRGWSTHVTLPERADVLVSETLGSEPLSERILELVQDARARLLAPGARLIPHDVRIWALPIEVPSEKLEEVTFRPEALARWQEWYGIDFSPLAPYTGRGPQNMMVSSQAARDWTPLAEPVLLATLDLSTFAHTTLDAAADFAIARAGTLGGAALYFDIGLGRERLSTHPALADDANHWSCAVALLPAPEAVMAGDRFRATYRYRVSGQSSGLRIARDDADEAPQQAS